MRSDRVVPVSADRLFRILATGEGQRQWAHGYRDSHWFGGEPPGVGSVRDVRMRWITVRERFLAWEPGARFAFTVDAMSLPLARQMIEDITFTALDARTCRLTWQVHLTPAPGLRPAGRLLVDRLFAPMFDGFAAGLAGYAVSPAPPSRW